MSEEFVYISPDPGMIEIGKAMLEDELVRLALITRIPSEYFDEPIRSSMQSYHEQRRLIDATQEEHGSTENGTKSNL